MWITAENGHQMGIYDNLDSLQRALYQPDAARKSLLQSSEEKAHFFEYWP
jgi:hypothetical protein